MIKNCNWTKEKFKKVEPIFVKYLRIVMGNMKMRRSMDKSVGGAKRTKYIFCPSFNNTKILCQIIFYFVKMEYHFFCHYC